MNARPARRGARRQDPQVAPEPSGALACVRRSVVDRLEQEQIPFAGSIEPRRVACDHRIDPAGVRILRAFAEHLIHQRRHPERENRVHVIYEPNLLERFERIGLARDLVHPIEKRVPIVVRDQEDPVAA